MIQLNCLIDDGNLVMRWTLNTIDYDIKKGHESGDSGSVHDSVNSTVTDVGYGNPGRFGDLGETS